MRKVIDTMLRVKTIREMRRMRELQQARDEANISRQKLVEANQQLEQYIEYRQRRQDELISGTLGQVVQPRDLEKLNQELVALRHKQQDLQGECEQADQNRLEFEEQERQAEQRRIEEAKNRNKFESLAEDYGKQERQHEERVDELSQEESEELRQSRKS